MFGKKPEPPKQDKNAIKRGGFGVSKKPPPKPPPPPAPAFKPLKAKCSVCGIGRVQNKENAQKTRYAMCNKCRQVFRYMPRNMKPKIWYEAFGPKPI